MVKINFAKQIQTLRLARSLSQKELAEEVGVTEQAVSKWETGRNLPDLQTAVAVAYFLQVKLDDLLLGSTITEVEKNENKMEGDNDMESWMNEGFGENRGFQLPATCAFPDTATCTFPSGAICSFNTPPPSACGLFNSSICANPWVAQEMCSALSDNGICSP